MADDEVLSSIGDFKPLSELLLSDSTLQIAIIILFFGLIGIAIANYKFSFWILKQKFSYVRPHASHLFRKIIFALIAIALIVTSNSYIQIFELFEDPDALEAAQASEDLTPREVFIKILDSATILLIGYVIAHLVPIIINKSERSKLERDDYESWKHMLGFADDIGDVYHKFFKWIPPKRAPSEMTQDEFIEKLKTPEGRKFLEEFHNTKGRPIGTYKQIIKDDFKQWKILERNKYEKYYDSCVSGKNSSGVKLRPGVYPPEIYPINLWREEKRINGYESIISGAKPPGYALKKLQNNPKSFTHLIPVVIFLATIFGIVSWWGINLLVLATATGGIAVGVGFALQETMANYFAYINIRKDRIFTEGDRIQLENGYNGFVDKITPRVTYLRHGLHESMAIVPTKMLTSAMVTSFSKDVKIVPARLKIGVSYLNDPDQVAAILVKIGKDAMTTITDKKRRHLVVQDKCPNREKNRPSCGCDKDIFINIDQPIVRFRDFSDSAIILEMWVYARDFGSQFKLLSEIRRMIFKEFKKSEIKIPWTIRTVYQGDEKKESDEISKHDEERKKDLEKYGVGNLD